MTKRRVVSIGVACLMIAASGCGDSGGDGGGGNAALQGKAADFCAEATCPANSDCLHDALGVPGCSAQLESYIDCALAHTIVCSSGDNWSVDPACSAQGQALKSCLN